MPDFRTLDGVNVSGQRVLVRVDLNVPMENGRVTDMTRIARVAPTIAELADKRGKIVVLSHFGRPGGKPVSEMSLRPLVEPLAAALKRPVGFAEDCVGSRAKQVVDLMKPGDIVLLENLRFHKEEEKNDPGFVDQLRCWATFTSTTPSPAPIARMPRPKAWPTACRRSPAA